MGCLSICLCHPYFHECLNSFQRMGLLSLLLFFFFFFFFFFVFFFFFRVVPAAYGGYQARGPVGAVAASLYHSHSNMGSELHLHPVPQLMAMLDP